MEIVGIRYDVNQYPKLNVFQAVRNTETARTTSTWVRTVLISNEEEAVQDQKPIDKSKFTRGDVSTVMKALVALSNFVHKGMVT
jgi:hypothetical protein